MKRSVEVTEVASNQSQEKQQQLRRHTDNG
jgi:hypothetical protein